MRSNRQPGILLILLAGLLAASPAAGAETASAPAAGHHSAAGKTVSLSADEALKRLQEGNRRFVAGDLKDYHLTSSTRHKLAEGQHPFAAVLGCADSRVPVEMIFNQGFGDLFTVRVAGNLATGDTEASLEYAVEHLGVPLILVLGHEKCGAVSAAVATASSGSATSEPLRVQELITLLQPAIRDTGDDTSTTDPVRRAVIANVQYQVNALRQDEDLKRALDKGHLKVIGAVYDLESGRVRFLPAGESSAAHPSAPARRLD